MNDNPSTTPQESLADAVAEIAETHPRVANAITAAMTATPAKKRAPRKAAAKKAAPAVDETPEWLRAELDQISDKAVARTTKKATAKKAAADRAIAATTNPRKAAGAGLTPAQWKKLVADLSKALTGEDDAKWKVGDLLVARIGSGDSSPDYHNGQKAAIDRLVADLAALGKEVSAAALRDRYRTSGKFPKSIRRTDVSWNVHYRVAKTSLPAVDTLDAFVTDATARGVKPTTSEIMNWLPKAKDKAKDPETPGQAAERISQELWARTDRVLDELDAIAATLASGETLLGLDGRLAPTRLADWREQVEKAIAGMVIAGPRDEPLELVHGKAVAA